MAVKASGRKRRTLSVGVAGVLAATFVSAQEPDARQSAASGAISVKAFAATAPLVSLAGASSRAAPAAASTARQQVAGKGRAMQTAMFSWPMTDTGEPAAISEEAMTTLAMRPITEMGIDAGSFGLVVQPLGRGALRVDHQGARAFNPASTMKLVTTFAALSTLGPQYRWATRFYTTGPIRDGVLHGDLIMQGGGDPHLVIEDLHALMAEMRAKGLRSIKGNLLIDDSRYAVRSSAGTPFDGDASAAYNVLPYAALMNFKATRLVLDPKKRRVTMDPPLADVQLRYDIKVLKGRCRPGATRFAVSEPRVEAGKPVVRVSGTQVAACGPQSFYAAVLDHQQFVHGIFKAGWKDLGGEFKGRTLIAPGAAARGQLLHEWVSSSDLAQVVRHINKYSNNVMTRMVLLEMAQRQGPGAVPPAQAASWVQQWYASQDLPLSSLIMENGSGLSRVSRISPMDMVAVLKRAAESESAWVFEDSLPVVGIDGTMRTRLRSDPVAGLARMKTGTLHDVRSIAGYVTAASGERYAVVLMINGNFESRKALAAQDELLRWVYRHG